MRRRLVLPWLVVACALLSACSVGAGSLGGRVQDVSWLGPFVQRSEIHDRLGAPLATRRDGAWRYEDQHNVVTATSNGFAAVVARTLLNVITVGLYELLAPPADMGADRQVVTRIFIYYNDLEALREARLRGMEAD